MGRGGGPEVRAIVVADMVGSSALRAKLGDEAADRLLRSFTEMANEAVARFDGIVRRWMGDGMTAAFPSASGAIAAALAIQRAVDGYSRRAEAVAPFRVRIGIGAGEVMYDPTDDEEHGMAIIEAARLEQLAEPGQILATDLVRLLGERRCEARFESLGAVPIKGLDEPVAIVRVIDPRPRENERPIPGALTIDRRFPLVGRADEVAAALAGWDEVTRGNARTLLVSGQPGIGKTRFAAQLADVAHGQHALVLFGVCDADLAVPYQPIARALADAADLHPELASAMTSGDGPLGALFPSRRSGRDDGGSADRMELFEAVVDVIEQLAIEQPLVIVLDDVQWATAPTMQMLRHLFRRLDNSRVLLVVTHRTENLSLAHPLNDLLVDARSSSRVTSIELEALEVGDITALINAGLASPGEHVGPFAARVLEESAGNPFFVCELLHHLSTTGQLEALVQSSGDRLPIPDSVRDLVGQRLARIAPEVADLLVTAAVVGHTFDLDLVAALLDRRVDDVVELVEQAEGVALVKEVDVGVFAFAHAIVRSSVLDRLSATRRALNHRRVAEALSELRPTDHDHLAMHWHLAGSDDRATVHRSLAARRDLEAFAFESAIERYQQLLTYYGSVETPEAAAAWLGIGYARRALGQPDYLAAMLEAGRLARRTHDNEVLADAAVGSIWPGTYLRPGEVLPGVVELAEDALLVLGPHDPRRPRALATVGVHDTDPQQRAAFLGEALKIAEQVGDPLIIGHVLVAEHIADCNPASLDRRAELITRIRRVARAAAVPELEYYAGLFAAFHAIERCDIVGARSKLAELESSARESHGVYLEFMAERVRVALDLFVGVPDVQARIDELASRFASTHADTTNTWAAQTAMLAAYEGRLGSLAHTLETVLADTRLGAIWRPTLGQAMALAGRRDEAAAVLAEFVEPPFDYFWLVSVQAAGDLAAEIGDAAKSRWLFDLLLPYRSQLCLAGPGSLCYGLVATTLGRLALVMDEPGVAGDLLTEAISLAERMGAPFDIARARRVMTEAHHALGSERSVIDRVAAPALIIAEEHGFALELELLRRYSSNAPSSV